MTGDRLSQLRTRIRKRRFHLFGLGLPKTGTTTLARMFSDYRSAHERGALQLLPLATRQATCQARDHEIRLALRRRDIRYRLEVDALHVLGMFASHLHRLYPKAIFAVTLRDCFSWIDSYLEHWRLNPHPDPRWVAYQRACIGPIQDGFEASDEVLRGAGLYSVNTLLRHWTTWNARLLSILPEERVLVIRTEDLDRSHDALARLCRIDPHTLHVRRLNVSPSDDTILGRVPKEFVIARARQSCDELMERFWGPSWLRCADLTRAWSR